MYTLLLTKPRFIKISLVLLQWPSPLPGSHARYTAFSCRGSSWLRQFPRLSLFLMTLTVLSIAQLFCRISLTLVLSDVFLLISLGLPIGKEDHRGEMQFLQHHIKGTCCWHDSLPMVLITWRRHLVARFLHCQVIFPFPVLYSLGASRVLFHLLEGQYRHELFGIFVMGDLSLPPHLFFNYLFLWFYYLLFIWVWMHFILWIINPKVINFVVYISFCDWITFLEHTPWGDHNWSGCLWGLCY